jgi:hypothetical protein
MKTIFQWFVLCILPCVFLFGSVYACSCGGDDDDSSGDDSGDDGGGDGNCDAQCEINLADEMLQCDIQWNHCEASEQECSDQWNTCWDPYYECAVECDSCVANEYYACTADCEDDACDDACWLAAVECNGWDVDCFQGCDATFDSCWDACADADCLDGCDSAHWDCEIACL